MSATEQRPSASIPDAVAVLDDSGTLLQSNHALAEMVPEAQVGQRLHARMGHLGPDGDPCPGGCFLDDPTQVGMSGALARPLREMVTAGNRARWVECTGERFDGDRTIISLRDVTALVHAEQDRAVLLEAAAHQQEQRRVLETFGARPHLLKAGIGGLSFDVGSAAAGPESPSGGEVVDVRELPDGRALIMIVDAVGAGVGSVRDAWRVLYVTRAFAMAGVPLPELIARSAAALAGETEAPKASLLIAVLDPVSGQLEVVAGGHPPALLVHENGTATWLEGTGRGIGAPEPGSHNVITNRVAPGDSLILYTDGVVDGTRDIVQGLSVLRSSATALRKRPSRGWAQGLIDAVVTRGRAHGDATVLVVRRQGPAEPDPGLHTTTTR